MPVFIDESATINNHYVMTIALQTAEIIAFLTEW